MRSTPSQKIATLSEKNWIWLLTLGAILIAWRVMYIQHGWINDDSVLYFEVARLFAVGEYQTGLSHYNWALYPALIAALHLITGYSLQLSAQLLNVVFFATTTYSFLALIQTAGGDKRTLLCGAALLFSTTYIVGDVLPMLLRDEGFWAFYLASIYFFIQYYRHQTLSAALLWQVCAIIAILFRVEAFTFFAVLPLIFLVTQKRAGLKSWIIAQSLGIAVALLTLLAFMLYPHLSSADFGRLSELVTVFERGYLNITEGFNAKAEIIATQVMGSFLDDYSMLVLVSGLIAILAHKCLLSAGWVTIGLIGLKYKQCKAAIANDALTVFIWVMALAVLNAVMILTNVFLLSGRYIASLGFILLILAAFCLDYFLKQPKKWLDYMVLGVMLVALAFGFITNLVPKKPGYNYEQEAVAWVKQHTNTDAVFYVSPRARYYADVPFQSRGYDYWDFTKKSISDGSIYQYAVLVINLDKDNPSHKKEKWLSKQLPEYRLVHSVYGYKKRKRILIYLKQPS